VPKKDAKLYQRGQVEDWEFEWSSDQLTWSPAEHDGIEADPVCFKTQVEVSESAYYLRSRSLKAGLYSDWSEPIPLPEPQIADGLAIGLLLLLVIAKLSSRIGS